MANNNSVNSDISMLREEDSTTGPAPWASLSQWCESHFSGYVYMLILAVVIGLVTGFLAFIFKRMIHALAYEFIPHIIAGFNWWLIAVPVAAIIITGIFTRYILHKSLTHVVAMLINDLKEKDYRLRHDLAISPIIGGTITLGLGGSSGAEGPIAATGAAVGSNLGQLLGVDKDRLKILLACGASAGIAGIFSAPVGGLMFSLELLRISLTTIPILAVTTASVTSFITILALSGFQADLYFVPQESFEWSTLPALIVLAIFCGLYSLYYSGVTNYMDKVYKKISNPWIRNISGGLLLGVILFMFPSMYSTGYPVLTEVIGGKPDAIANGSVLEGVAGGGLTTLMLIAGGILICKCWAVSATNSSGGCGGDFAPTLYAGGIAGFLFATACNIWFDSHLPVGLFAFYGMAGVMSGVIRTPLMSIFIVIEMTTAYTLTFPVSICALISYLTVKGGAITEAQALPLVKHLNWIR